MVKKVEERDEFFDEPNGEKTPLEPTMSPTKEGKTPKNTKKSKKKAKTAICAVSLAVVSFALGLGVGPLLIDEELRDIIKIKRSIQDMYYYDVTDEQFYKALFEAINEDVLDPYSAYMNGEEYAANQSQAAGNRSGTGLLYATKTYPDYQEVYVNSVRGNSPAEKAGLVRGDRIVAVGETQEDLMTLTNYAQLKTFIEGQATDDIFYMQYSRGGATQTVQLSNSAFVENYVYYRTGETSYAFAGKNADVWTETSAPIVGLPQDTAYIRLTKFNGGAATQFFKAMNVFKADGKKQLVLDLRGNGGGYMHIFSEIAAYFCKSSTDTKPLAAVAEYKDGRKEYFYAARNVFADYFDGESKIYLMADVDSASASECLIGAMVDYGALAMENICLIERNGVAKTYGKGIMQTTYPLGIFYPDAIRLTTAQIKWPVSGHCIHGVGVTYADGCKKTMHVFDGDSELYGGLTALGIL